MYLSVKVSCGGNSSVKINNLFTEQQLGILIPIRIYLHITHIPKSRYQWCQPTSVIERVHGEEEYASHFGFPCRESNIFCYLSNYWIVKRGKEEEHACSSCRFRYEICIVFTILSYEISPITNFIIDNYFNYSGSGIVFQKQISVVELGYLWFIV